MGYVGEWKHAVSGMMYPILLTFCRSLSNSVYIYDLLHNPPRGTHVHCFARMLLNCERYLDS